MSMPRTRMPPQATTRCPSRLRVVTPKMSAHHSRSISHMVHWTSPLGGLSSMDLRADRRRELVRAGEPAKIPRPHLAVAVDRGQGRLDLARGGELADVA